MHPSRCRSRSVGGAQGAGGPARGWQPATRRGSARDRSRPPRSSGACPVLRWAVWGSSVGIVAQLPPLTACLHEPAGRQRIVSECATSAQQCIPRMSASGFVRLSTALSPQPADRLSPRRSRSLQAVQSVVPIRWRCTGWWGSGPRLAACIPAKVLLREAASLLAGYIRARISRHAYHSTHTLARILRHAYQSTHITARVARHVGSCLLAASLQARACGLVFAGSLQARVCRLPVPIQ